MHALALESGESFDMCYTALPAHITMGCFVCSSFFASLEARHAFVELITKINESLRALSDGAKDWILGKVFSLELQLGYLKFVVERECADLLERSS
jgi:hypothetical protein